MRTHSGPAVRRSRVRRTAHRIARACALAVLLSALSVLASALTATGAAADTGTYVRLAQLSSDMSSVTLTISSVADPAREVVLPSEPYGALSAYQRIEPGDYVVAVRSGDASVAIVGPALKAEPGAAYTLASVGAADQRSLQVFTDDLTPPPSGRARVRLINAAALAPVIDVRGPGGSAFSTGLPHAQASDYRTVDAGSLRLSAGPPGAVSTDLTVPVGANQVISVVLVGDGSRVAAQPHVDASGPAAVPPGPIEAGYGGAADPRGPLAELVLGGLAVAAGVASVVLSRRDRNRGSASRRAC